MKFGHEASEPERRLIEHAFNQLLGQLAIRVFHAEVRNDVRLLVEPLTETRTLPIGRTERLVIRIEKERKLLFGLKCRVYLSSGGRTDFMQQ